MQNKMSSLLRAVADYHSFCNPSQQSAESRISPNELSEAELDLVAAATKTPTVPANIHESKK